MRKTLSLILLALFVVSGLYISSPTGVTASTATQQVNCNPVDFVFLIDHTTKMQQVDPSDLRIQAVRWIIMLLGYDHMYFCPDTSYRIGVIEYGGQTTLASNVIKDIPLTEVAPRLGQGLESWRSEWKGLVAQVKEPPGDRSRNLLDAFRTANKMLDATNDGRKQMVIVFNADWGSPCTLGNDCMPFDAQQIIKGSKDVLPVPKNNRFLWFYAFPDDSPADLESYAGVTWENLLNNISPDSTKFIRVQDTSTTYGVDLAKNLAEIFFSVNNRAGSVAESGCNFAIPHFVKKTGFLIYKSDTLTKTAIDDPDPQTPAIVASSVLVGNMKISDSPNNIPAGNVEPFIIDRPMPGDWKIRECAASMYVLRFQFFADNLAVVEPPEVLPQYSNPNLPDQLSDPNQKFDLKFKLADDNNDALIQYDGANPVINGQIEMPGGKKLQLKFVYDSSDKLYHSREPLPTRYIGNYNWEIVFKRNTQAESVNLLGGYEVKKVTPLKLVVDLPFSNSTTIHAPCIQASCFLKLNVQSFQVSARFVDENDINKSIRFRELFPGAEQTVTIEATLTHMQSRKKQTVLLRPSIKDDYTFTGDIGDLLDLDGEYLLEATLYPEEISKMNLLYRFFADSSVAKAKFIRTDNVQTNPITYFLIFGLVSTILFVMFLRGAWAFTNPIDGNLVFARLIPSLNGSEQYKDLITIPLAFLHKRHRNLSRAEIARKSRLLNHLGSIKAWKVRKNGQSGIELTLYLDHPSVQDKKQKTILWDERKNQYKLPGGIYMSYTSTSTGVDAKGEISSARANSDDAKPNMDFSYEQDSNKEN